MGSSGVIYAIIVGAWAVYLVPMWLRREDELNRARETQRYATAIKVLAHKEAFERRWAQTAETETEEALPLAAGQNVVSGPRVPKRPAAAKPATAGAMSTAAARTSASPERRPAIAASSSSNSGSKTAVTAIVAGGPPRINRANAKAPTQGWPVQQAIKAPGPRTGLMARRRRAVGAMFTATTLGALVSADLGAQYVWAMVAPAVLLSAYIVRLRRDERLRAAARAHRRLVAQQAREAREANEAERRARREAEAAAREAEFALAEAEAAAEAAVAAEQRRRAQAARRRSSAAGRARAQGYAQTENPQDLRRASNG
jgi:hypothetical protein